MNGHEKVRNVGWLSMANDPKRFQVTCTLLTQLVHMRTFRILSKPFKEELYDVVIDLIDSQLNRNQFLFLNYFIKFGLYFQICIVQLFVDEFVATRIYVEI